MDLIQKLPKKKKKKKNPSINQCGEKGGEYYIPASLKISEPSVLGINKKNPGINPGQPAGKGRKKNSGINLGPPAGKGQKKKKKSPVRRGPNSGIGTSTDRQTHRQTSELIKL
jgi:hypothetical protein